MARKQAQALEQSHERSQSDGFVEHVKKLVGSCGVVVDFASMFIQNTCRAETSTVQEDNLETFPPHNTSSRTKRRQGATLEFSPRSGFEDDDVSAISAHTLEEMERRNMLKHARQLNALDVENLPADVEAPPPSGLGKPKRKPSILKQHLKYSYPIERDGSTGESISIGVSTSGSASSAEADAK